ncbi:MAG: enoyl-CoA hydratase/isomerase family protein [Pseudomonadota bacterium]|nr:enoyl-CoA hydratase/isomerase family protein [Pseudomonadota bacterium]
MDYEGLLYEVEDSIATITLNRPEAMNALTPKMEADLHRAFDDADADKDVRVIIMTGAGAAFSAGYDQGAGESGRKKTDPTGLSIAEYLEAWQRGDAKNVEKWGHMWKLGKPIIAAVNGWAMGGGFWYQLAADITIASEKAVFAQPEVRHVSNTTYLFTALCGWKNANRWALTGDHFDAEEAYRIGMINELVPHDELMDKARALAARIALVPEPAVRLNKAIAMQGIQAAGINAALILEGTLGAIAHSSHTEYREALFEKQRTDGVRSYLQMRDGPFQPEPMGPRSVKGRAAKKS